MCKCSFDNALGRDSVSSVAKKKTSSKKAKRSTGTTSRSTGRRVVKKKATTKKTATKKAVAKKKAPAKKAASKKKVTTKKAASKKAPSKKKVVTKKAASKKAVTKKVTSKKAAGKKTTTKKVVGKSKAKTPQGAPVRRRRRQTVVEAVLASETDSRGFVVVNGRKIRRISAEPAKKTRKRSTAADDAAKLKKATDEKPVKTKLSKAELEHFRMLLLAKRRELLAAVDSMEYEALRSDDGDTSNMPIHMADVGSDVYEQDLMLGMAASERQRIREIIDALHRISDGTYGVCALTKKAISKKRLNAKPWAKYTIDAARQIERGL